MPPRTVTTPRRRWLTVPLGALALVVAFPATAFAAPPPGLPGNADSLERAYQPAYDYDADGCYHTGRRRRRSGQRRAEPDRRPQRQLP
ncbi:hypothetical protein STENM36S_01624 [Streptomyces tendae]